MKIVCAKEELAARLSAAGRAASAKGTIPVLAAVLVRAEDGRIELSATDMELSIRMPLQGVVEEAGAVVLPRLAAEIVRTMPPGEVTLEHRRGEGVVTLRGGSSMFNLNCLQADEFPELPSDEGAGFSMPAAVLTGTVERVVKAASRDETRPVLTGVFVRIGPDGLTMVATDSYRLAVKQSPLDSPPSELREAIVPARALSEAARLVGASKAEAVDVVLGESQAVFRVAGPGPDAGEVRLTARVIDGQFPDYRQLVPDAFEHEVAFDRGELLATLSRIAVLAQRTTPVRMAFAEGEVTLSATAEQVGEGRESLPAAFSGDPLEMGFNVEFLRGGVESVEGQEVRIGLISPLRPGLLRGEGDDYRYLLMPIRLNA